VPAFDATDALLVKFEPPPLSVMLPLLAVRLTAVIVRGEPPDASYVRPVRVLPASWVPALARGGGAAEAGQADGCHHRGATVYAAEWTTAAPAGKGIVKKDASPLHACRFARWSEKQPARRWEPGQVTGSQGGGGAVGAAAGVGAGAGGGQANGAV